MSLSKSIVDSPGISISKSAFTTDELCTAAVYAIKIKKPLIIKELLFHACTICDVKLFQKILEISSPNMIMQSQGLETILHFAIYLNRITIVIELLKCKAGVDILMEKENSSLAATAHDLGFYKLAGILGRTKQQIELLERMSI